MSILSGMDAKTMMQYAPGFAMGTSGFIQPDMASAGPDVHGHAGDRRGAELPEHTGGQARSLDAATQRALQVQGMRNQGDMDELRFKAANPAAASAGSPVAVSPGTSDKLYEMILQQLAGQFPDANLENLDPAAVNALRSRAAQNYQVSKNAEAAVADALSGVPLEPYTYDTWEAVR
jgi:hypothetical protein